MSDRVTRQVRLSFLERTRRRETNDRIDLRPMELVEETLSSAAFGIAAQLGPLLSTDSTPIDSARLGMWRVVGFEIWCLPAVITAEQRVSLCFFLC